MWYFKVHVSMAWQLIIISFRKKNGNATSTLGYLIGVNNMFSREFSHFRDLLFISYHYEKISNKKCWERFSKWQNPTCVEILIQHYLKRYSIKSESWESNWAVMESLLYTYCFLSRHESHRLHDLTHRQWRKENFERLLIWDTLVNGKPFACNKSHWLHVLNTKERMNENFWSYLD